MMSKLEKPIKCDIKGSIWPEGGSFVSSSDEFTEYLDEYFRAPKRLWMHININGVWWEMRRLPFEDEEDDDD